MIAPEIESLFTELDRSLQVAATPILSKDRPVHIYGAGNIGKEIRGILQRRNQAVAAFLDRRAQPGSEWEGTPILTPDTDQVTPGQRKEAQVIIGVFNRDADLGEIMGLLDSLGYGRVISFLEFHHEFHAELGDRFWLTRRDFYRGQKEAIAAADRLWSDESSRKLYRALLKMRFAMRYDSRPAVSLEDQYFPADIPPWPSPLRLADCGAFDGDTLRYLAAPGRKIAMEAVAAFEPDLLNYEKLAEFAGSGALKGRGTICLFPCGVGARTERIRFSEGRGEGSSVSESGSAVIQCVTLDSALAGFRPNLIKMDIEGSELDALIGARRILSQNRPGLAICVYHRPGHLWEIPNMVGQLMPGGRHYLRCHAYNGLELVYYWVP